MPRPQNAIKGSLFPLINMAYPFHQRGEGPNVCSTNGHQHTVSGSREVENPLCHHEPHREEEVRGREERQDEKCQRECQEPAREERERKSVRTWQVRRGGGRKGSTYIM